MRLARIPDGDPVPSPAPAALPSRAVLEVMADPNGLLAARQALAGALARMDWDRDETCRVLIAADEALANAVEHGSLPGANVSLGFAVEPAGARVVVTDAGGTGDHPPRQVPAEPPDETATHGRGLIIMAALCDRLTMLSWGPGTRVEMRFRRLSPQAAAA